MNNSRIILFGVAVGALLCTGAPCLAAGTGASTRPSEAISKPSEDVTLAFDKPGLIAKIMVKEGDSVKAGQTIVQQDNGPEMAQLDSLKADAEDDVKIRAAIEQLSQKKVDLQRMVEAKKKNVATDLDVDHARLDVTIAELSEELARFQHAQDGRKYLEAKLELERMKITSPIDGKVEKIFEQAGEAPEAHAKIIRIVKLDPLWVDVPLPIDQAATMQIGRQVQVNFPTYGKANPQAQTGKVIFIAPIEEAASQTVTVRVEVPNANQRRAGERVTVEFLDTMAPAQRAGSVSDPAGATGTPPSGAPVPQRAGSVSDGTAGAPTPATQPAATQPSARVRKEMVTILKTRIANADSSTTAPTTMPAGGNE